jgi:hypothetical protein
MSRGGADPPPDFDSQAAAFQQLVTYKGKSAAKPSISCFVKKLDQTPEVCLRTVSRYKALTFAEKGLVNQFTGLWPTLRHMETWIQRSWQGLIKGPLNFFCRRGFFAFLFEFEDDRDLNFRSGPYFYGTRGMFLNRWTPNFDPEVDIPSVVLLGVHLPLHY